MSPAAAGGSGRYALGIDFGTESGRAVLVDCADGRELGTAVHTYANGVIDECLPPPDEDVGLEADWALQDPDDYLAVYREAVPALLAETGVDPAEVIGIGIDFTSCTMLPTTADGTPLCHLEEWRRNPHAWVKLWKHHAAQPEADRINAVATERGEPWLPRYGGRISSEWFIAKSLQILVEAPELCARAGRLIEGADWAVWQLTGVETRSSCTAGYKAMWSKRDGFPSDAYFAALDPRFEHVIDEKMSRESSRSGPAPAASPSVRRPGRGSGRVRRSPSRTWMPTSRLRLSRSPSRGRWSRSWARAPATSCSATSPPWSRACAGWSRTASSPVSTGSRRGSRPSATSSGGSWRAVCRRRITRPRAGAA